VCLPRFLPVNSILSFFTFSLLAHFHSLRRRERILDLAGGLLACCLPPKDFQDMVIWRALCSNDGSFGLFLNDKGLFIFYS